MVMNNPSIKISIFFCANSFSAEEIQYCNSKIDDVQINAISLPCTGKVNLLYLLKTIETGSDGVIVMTCKIGECKYLQGNLRARKRIEAVDDLLYETGFGGECIKCINIEEGNKIDRMVSEIKVFMNYLKTKPELIKENVYDQTLE
jgi:coenzyme F420-reducing hydrogenase delta subunit